MKKAFSILIMLSIPIFIFAQATYGELEQKIVDLNKDINTCVNDSKLLINKNLKYDKIISTLEKSSLEQDSIIIAKEQISNSLRNELRTQDEAFGSINNEYRLVSSKYFKEVKRKKRWRTLTIVGVPVTVAATLVTVAILK